MAASRVVPADMPNGVADRPLLQPVAAAAPVAGGETSSAGAVVAPTTAMTAAAATSPTGAHLEQDARGGNGGAQRPAAGGGRGGTTGALTAGAGGGGNGESSSHFGNSLSSLARRTFASLRLSRRGTPPPSSSGGGAGNRLLPASQLQDGSRAALSPGPDGLNGWGPGIPPRLGCVTAVGFAEDPNPRHRPTMEDAHVVLDAYLGDRGAGFFGIYDGHGGRAAVDVVATILHRDRKSVV